MIVLEGRKHQGALVDVPRLSLTISKCDLFPDSQTHLRPFIRSEPVPPSKHSMKSEVKVDCACIEIDRACRQTHVDDGRLKCETFVEALLDVVQHS